MSNRLVRMLFMFPMVCCFGCLTAGHDCVNSFPPGRQRTEGEVVNRIKKMPETSQADGSAEHHEDSRKTIEKEFKHATHNEQAADKKTARPSGPP